MNLSHGDAFTMNINTTSCCSHSQVIVTAAASTMTKVKFTPTVLLLVALLTKMLFQIASIGLHIADLIGKREDIDQQNGKATLCNISSFNWRRVTYINVTDPKAECPCGLNKVCNNSTGQRACGRSVNHGCSSLTFPVNTDYSHVCGYARGYQYHSPSVFSARTVDDPYVEGLSITHGNPRKHIWSLAVGLSELGPLHWRCPRDRGTLQITGVPDFVNNDFYCETGFINSVSREDPLWDGQQCVSSTALSCSRYGWFHREITPSQEDIEVRWCADEVRSNEDVFTDHDLLVEIWVLELYN